MDGLVLVDSTELPPARAPIIKDWALVSVRHGISIRGESSYEGGANGKVASTHISTESPRRGGWSGRSGRGDGRVAWGGSSRGRGAGSLGELNESGVKTVLKGDAPGSSDSVFEVVNDTGPSGQAIHAISNIGTASAPMATTAAFSEAPASPTRLES